MVRPQYGISPPTRHGRHGGGRRHIYWRRGQRHDGQTQRARLVLRDLHQRPQRLIVGRAAGRISIKCGYCAQTGCGPLVLWSLTRLIPRGSNAPELSLANAGFTVAAQHVDQLSRSKGHVRILRDGQQLTALRAHDDLQPLFTDKSQQCWKTPSTSLCECLSCIVTIIDFIVWAEYRLLSFFR